MPWVQLKAAWVVFLTVFQPLIILQCCPKLSEGSSVNDLCLYKQQQGAVMLSLPLAILMKGGCTDTQPQLIFRQFLYCSLDP